MNKKKINLYLHFGAEKTGSTSIQHILNQNRKDLIKAGLLYLGEDLTWNSKPCLNHQNFFRALNLLSHEKQLELAKQKIVNWVNFAENRKVKNILISWESAKIPSPFLESLKKSPFLNIIPIIYVRNQTDWLKSGWKQYGCKIQGMNNISDWVKFAIKDEFWENKINWAKRIDQIASLFGNKNLVVKSYDAEKAALIESFISIFNITLDKLTNLEKSNDFNNKPLRPDLIELVKHSRSLLSSTYSEELTNMFSYFLEEEAFISSSKEGYFISDEDAALVQNHFSTSNNFVAKTYFSKSAEEIFVSNNQKQEITQEKEYKLEDFVATYVELLFKRDQKIKSIEKKIKKQMAKSVIN